MCLIWPNEGIPFTAFMGYCTDWYEIWAWNHEIYYIKFELEPWQTSFEPFSETEKGFGVGLTFRDSLYTRVSPILSWKWPCTTLSPFCDPFFEGSHSFGRGINGFTKIPKTFKSCPDAQFLAKKKKICCSGKIYRTTADLVNSFILLFQAITPERVAHMAYIFGSLHKIRIQSKNLGLRPKSIPRCEMDRLSEGYKQAIDKIWSPMAKNGFLGWNPGFGPKKTLTSWF